MTSQVQNVFNDIYSNNLWGEKESVSGPGSTQSETGLLRQQLPWALRRFDIQTLVDAPCGDMNWMRVLEYDFKQYIGIDIVSDLIANLRVENCLPNRHFQIGNIVTDILPYADAVFCRDCLVHLPFAMIHSAIKHWKLAGFRYAILTTFRDHVENSDCNIGEWRPLNFVHPPFNWPSPELLINEYPADLGWKYRDKCVGFWSLANINVSG